MKSNVKKIICSIIAVFLSILTAVLYCNIKKHVFPRDYLIFSNLVIFLSFTHSFVIAGIPSLIRTIAKRKSHISESLLFGVYINIIVLFLTMMFFDTKIVAFYFLSGSSTLLILFHAIFMTKIGVCYSNFFKLIIESLFSVKIISKKEFNAEKSQEIKNAEKKQEDGSTDEQKSKEQVSVKKIKRIPIISPIGMFFSAIIKFLSKHKKLSIISASLLILIFFVIIGGSIFYSYSKGSITATIVDFSPKGEAENQTVIKVLYSDEVKFKDASLPGEVFNITPKINGVYRITGNTVMLIPDKELPISTSYKLIVNSSLLKSSHKKIVESKTFYFNTKLLSVDKADFYYEIDEQNQKITGLIGEIEFNIPVDFSSLKERILVKLNNSNLQYNLEKSERNNIFYLKVLGVEPQEKQMNIEITIKKGVSSIGGTDPLSKDFTKLIPLKEKDRLIVENCQTYPVVGTTYLAIKFNFPVIGTGIKNFISIEPPIDFDIDSEYRYIILKADFKVNKNYQIYIKKDLKAKNGTQMKEDYVQTVRVNDIPPYVKFVNDGMILPKSNNLNIEFVSLNLDTVNFSVEKVYKNNLINYLRNNYSDNRKYLYQKTLNIDEGELNQEIKNLINLKDLSSSEYSGIYYLSLSDPKAYYNYSRMFVHITEMGLIVKNDENNLLIYVVNLLNLNPIPNVKLSLISSENQILQEGYSDSTGKVIFGNYKKTRENLNPYLIFAENRDDFTYLTLSANQIDYSTFDTSGVNFDKTKHEAFLTTERGLYRPGEPVYTTIIVRKSDLSNPEEIPLKAKVIDPTGNQVFEEVIKIDSSGMTSVKIPTKMSYKTGDYSIHLYQSDNYSIGYTSFKIEEFIPHTIKVDVELVSYENGVIRYKVKSNELHGAPSKNLKVYSEIRFVSREFISPKFKDYRFYNDNRSDFYQTRLDMGESELNEIGEIYYEVVVPDYYFPPSALDAVIYADVFDSAGRPVSSSLVVAVDRYDNYFGVNVSGKKPFAIDTKIDINYISIDSNSNPTTSKDVYMRVERKVWYSIFKKYSWTSGYSSEYYTEVLFNKKIDINGKGSWSFIPDTGGYYTVSIGYKDGMMTTDSFYVYEKDVKYTVDLSDPSKLTMTLDKKSYLPGETAYVTIASPFDGKCLVSIERDKIYKSDIYTLSNGKIILPIVVGTDFVPNMYVTAMAFRTPDYKLNTLPPVSYGAINITMNKEQLSQKINVDTQKTIRSSDGLNVKINIPNGANSQLVLAAVDEGILQISAFRTPEPYDYFYRKRRLSIRTNTSLKGLLPDIAPYKKVFGGGGEDDYEERHLNPIEAKRVKSISIYSGILQCDEFGNLDYNFKIPEFNGKLRVMVLSANGNKFGSAQTFVTVSDPIVLSPGIPRILAPNDIAEIPLRVFNKTGKDGKIKVELTVKGPLEIDGKNSYDLDIKNENETKVLFKVKAINDAGIGYINFYANGNGETSKSETELAVRPASPLDTTVLQGVIKPNSEQTLNLTEDYIKEGGYQRFAISNDKLIRFVSALDYLINYPYGCTEQITSQTFPLLYLREYAQYVKTFSMNQTKIDRYISFTINQLKERQLDSGGFAMWNGGTYEYEWVSDYASHFLIEAKRIGFSVPDSMYEKILIRIGAEEIKKGRLDRRDDNRGIQTPYHLFLKSLIGKPDYDSMKYYYDIFTDTKVKKDNDEMGLLLISAAYALVNDKDRAKELLPSNFMIKTTIRKISGNFDSFVRNSAFYIFVLNLINPDDSNINKIVDDFYKNLSKKGNFGNTQDTAWVLLAISNIKEARAVDMNVDIFHNDTYVKNLTNKEVFINKFDTGELKIVNNSQENIYYNFFNSGIPLHPDTKKVESGLIVDKNFYTVDGNVLDIAGVKKGTQAVVTLTVKSPKKINYENLILVDLLPSGFEIENVRISSRGEYNVSDNNIYIDNIDIRDDRIIIAANNIKDEITYSYVVRAVSIGEFVIPQFLCEVMYDPDIFGKSESNKKLKIIDDE